MTYSECIDYIKSVLNSVDFQDVCDCNLQFNIIGKDSGVFYIEVRDHVPSLYTVECNKYQDKYVFTLPAFIRIIDKTVDPVYAYTTGKFKMMGDVALGRQVLTKLAKA